MDAALRYNFSGPVSVFHGRRLPEEATPAGYAALIDASHLRVPVPLTLAAIGRRHKVYARDGWKLFTPRHGPDATVAGHLIFALKYEGVDLAVLARLFEAVPPEEIEQIVRATPTGSYARRIWFLYEWLMQRELDLPPAGKVRFVDVLDSSMQFSAKGEPVHRQRVRNNLPGTRAFCPLVFRTGALEELIALDLPARARAVVAAVPRDLLARTASFLLLKDSRSSYAIEGERPPQNRVERWGRAIGDAGKHALDLDELIRLQQIVIGDARFVFIGLRSEAGFVGEHDRVTHAPLPEHISARPEDLLSLLEGMIAFDLGGARDLDPVIAAAALAFGFVYVHPFQDGNGRIHRYLIHHVLAERGFNPPGVIFPVSAAIFDEIDDYASVLRQYSERLLPLIEWQPTEDNNVRVLNNTADFYRFFDATPHAEFLYRCVRTTIEHDLPREVEFLRRYDRFRAGVDGIVNMPDRTIDLLFRFLRQNGGRLFARARRKEFAALTDEEIESIERLFYLCFGSSEPGDISNSP
ncbi:MAG TPA: Fic family protein [Woeseiaceae bacterium]